MDMETDRLFSKQDLKRLIIPLVLEQLLAVTIGMADTVMVSSAGEAAVSGVSLVDTINVLLINIFSALATGGAVVASQYLGRREEENACASAQQLVATIAILALAIMGVSLAAKDWLLRLIFGGIEADVMRNAQIYFLLSALSYPFLAIYNAGAALFRSMGNSKISLETSVVMNLINVIGNAITIYGFQMGVFGAALATLISRIVGAVVMLVLLRNRANPIHIVSYRRLTLRFDMIKRILQVGVPNGLENGMFQFGKILVQGLIATFGTSAIAANAVGNSVAGIAIIPGSAIGLAMITIVGRCVGAQDYDQARYYTKLLMKMTYGSMLFLNLAEMLACRWIISCFHLSPEASSIALEILIAHSICCIFIWPMSFTLPNALRAAGDARFTMICSVISMWTCRVIMSYVLAQGLDMGVMGVWIAMFMDWVVRAVIFYFRFRGPKWTEKKII